MNKRNFPYNSKCSFYDFVYFGVSLHFLLAFGHVLQLLLWHFDSTFSTLSLNDKKINSRAFNLNSWSFDIVCIHALLSLVLASCIFYAIEANLKRLLKLMAILYASVEVVSSGWTIFDLLCDSAGNGNAQADESEIKSGQLQRLQDSNKETQFELVSAIFVQLANLIITTGYSLALLTHSFSEANDQPQAHWTYLQKFLLIWTSFLIYESMLTTIISILGAFIDVVFATAKQETEHYIMALVQSLFYLIVGRWLYCILFQEITHGKSADRILWPAFWTSFFLSLQCIYKTSRLSSLSWTKSWTATAPQELFSLGVKRFLSHIFLTDFVNFLYITCLFIFIYCVFTGRYARQLPGKESKELEQSTSAGAATAFLGIIVQTLADPDNRTRTFQRCTKSSQETCVQSSFQLEEGEICI